MKHIRKIGEFVTEKAYDNNHRDNITYVGVDKFDNLELLLDEVNNFALDLEDLINSIKNDGLEEKQELKKVVSDVLKIRSKLEEHHGKLFDYLDK